MKIEIIKDELAPGGEGASLGAARTKDGEEGFATKALGVHAGEMTQPAESAGTEQGDNGREAAFLLHGDVSDSAVGGVGDAQHVSGRAHLETRDGGCRRRVEPSMFQSPTGRWKGQWS